MKIVKIEDAKVSVGEFITVVEWIGRTDRSYTNDVLKVIAVDGNLIRAHLQNHGMDITLNADHVKLRKVTPKFAKLVGAL